MVFLVFHNAKFMELRQGEVDHSRLAFVSAVQANRLSDVFSFTNHIQDGWQHGDHVLAGMYAPRSTSAGDIIVDEDIQMHLVAERGFKNWGEVEETRGLYDEMLTAFRELFSLGKSGIHPYAAAAHDLIACATGAYSNEEPYSPHFRLLPEYKARYAKAFKAIFEDTEKQ